MPNMNFLYLLCSKVIANFKVDNRQTERQDKKSRSVCETLCLPAATESEKAIFRTKVKVKVTMPLTLVSFERVSLVEYASQI